MTDNKVAENYYLLFHQFVAAKYLCEFRREIEGKPFLNLKTNVHKNFSNGIHVRNSELDNIAYLKYVSFNVNL